MLLYKYRSAMSVDESDNTSKIFQNASIYYAKASSFNDPFDGRVNVEVQCGKESAIDRHFRAIRDRLRERGLGTDQAYQTWINAKQNVDRIYDDVLAGTHIDHDRYYLDRVDEIGVLALSEQRDNLLLWAHYADNHKGLCLGFEWGETGLPDAKEVLYQTRYRTLDYFSHTEDEVAEISLFQKSAEWAYEREWRSVMSPEREKYSSFEPTDSARKEIEALGDDPDEFHLNLIKREHTYAYWRVTKPGWGALAYEKSSLKEVVFGMRMSDAEVDRHVKAIESYGFTPQFYRAKRHAERYALSLMQL